FKVDTHFCRVCSCTPRAYAYVNSDPDYTVVCNIVLDEMSIRIHTDWDGTIMHGFVDIDTNIEI
ncbi:THAP-type domain-containing protein, partial [Aphis craccivora]